MTEPADTTPIDFERLDEGQMRERANQFYERMRTRRSVRDFAPDPVPIDVLERCIEAAAQAPSGANKQPWTFVLVTDPAVKRQIRDAAEAEERAFYAGRATQRWLSDLEPLGTGPEKPFLETAPAVVAVFAQRHGADSKDRHYYVSESVGIAVGFLLAALHSAGLATLTHTPAPMKFLAEILGRPSNEKPFVLIPVGYPTDDCRVPNIERKSLDEVLVKK
jgi:iodotyrosine deiodinase